jgi:hypothetical protein
MDREVSASAVVLREHTMASTNKRSAMSAALRGALLALAFAGVPGVALAQPPAAGTTHTFFDPVFRGTVFCDTFEAVHTIAKAKTPDETYANYFLTTNERDEPICMAIAPTAVVVDVVPMGVMVKHGHHFNAWAIETRVDGVTAFALYLERFDYVGA